MDEVVSGPLAGTEESGAYRVFDRAEWAALRSSTPLPLTDADVKALRGVADQVSLAEVADVHLPLSRLLNLHVTAARSLAAVQDTFLGRPARVPPYVIAVAGSVAVGKSTFARLLRAVLARWPDHPRVQLVTTDGFLLPTKMLEARGLMRRKGFPESYDLRRMIAFLRAVKAGEAEARAPVYSHLSYDIVPGESEVVSQPDILIFEGLNVLQTAGTSVLASDFFDFSVYVDAAEEDIESWYVQRFLVLQRTAFQDPRSYFHHYKDLSEEEAKVVARGIWRDINLPNLVENIQPTRPRAHLVLTKGPDHAVREVALRQM
ncbi:type I pantothenate kinase [Roseomonas populi]|uniref:Pantothenate kinase n=1 Tax=Roseomonas populi TaxID=3121582 RepID=A0ABT1X0S7_9PROT|nr:type I pantothenate kinase [Roseomonas pecuniae]MCR0981703.1 type I pantothenate kinase [Roseomonas pecuniae]